MMEECGQCAGEWTTSIIEIPKALQYYIDYDRMARDWEMSGDIFTIEIAHDEVHLFWELLGCA